MSNKEVTLLMKDGTFLRKLENMINIRDLSLSKYIMIRTYNEEDGNRNFFINHTNELLDFDRAVVEYQILLVSVMEDDEGYVSVPLDPIHVETKSISDVLSLLNCIDRLNCINNMISNEENCGAEFQFNLEYIGVTLYRGDNVIYDQYYKYRPTSQSRYYSYTISKHFSELYSTNICNDLSHDRLAISLNSDMTWSLIDEKEIERFSNTSLYGIVLNQSNTFTFCTKDEYLAMRSLKHLRYTFVVHDSNKSIVREINDCVRNGKYDELEEIGESLSYLLDSYTNLSLIGAYRNFHIDFFSHMNFILTLTNIAFNEIYKVQSDDLSYDQLKELSLESAISMIFTYSGKLEKEIYFTADSVIPISQIFKLFM